MSSVPGVPFERLVALPRHADDGVAFTRAATADEDTAVAEVLGVDEVVGLRVEGSFAPAGSMMRLTGRVSGRVLQPCVVTFEAVATDVGADFERYIVVGEEPVAATVEVVPDDRDVVHVAEPFIDVGAIAVEELALAVPAYPRAPNADAVLAAVEQDAADAGPFAVLARRRDAS